MLSNPAIIASLVNQNRFTLSRSAIGTIEKAIDSSNFVLRIGNDSIVIQTEKSDLQPGDIVSCTLQRDKVILEKVNIKQQDFSSGSNSSFSTGDSVNCKDLEKDIESLPQNMKSKALQSIDPQILKTIIQKYGNLSLETLHQIDNLLTESNLQASAARAGSTSAQTASNEQWLLTLFENHIPPLKLAPFFPVSTAASLSGLLENVSTALKNLPVPIQSTLSLEDFAIIPQRIFSTDNTGLIPETVSRLGFNFENSMAKGVIPQDNLKGELLKVLGQLDNVLTSQPQLGSCDNQESELIQNTNSAIDELESRLLKIIQNITGNPIQTEGILLPDAKVESDILKMLTQISSSLSQLDDEQSLTTSSTFLPFKIPDEQTLSDLFSILSPDSNENLPAEALIKKFISSMQDFFSSGQQPNKSFQMFLNIAGILKAGAELVNAQSTSGSETDISPYKVHTAKELATFAVSDFVSEMKANLNSSVKTGKETGYTEQIDSKSVKPEQKPLLLPRAEIDFSRLRFEIIKTVSSLTSGINGAGELLKTAGYGLNAQLTESLKNELISIPVNAFTTIDNRISQINLFMGSIKALSDKENDVPGAVEVLNEKLSIIRNTIPEFTGISPDKTLFIKASTDQLSRLIDDISSLSSIFSKAITQSVSELSLKAADPEAIRFFEIYLSNLSNQLKHELRGISLGIEQLRTGVDSLSHSDLQKINQVHSGENLQNGTRIPDQPVHYDSTTKQVINQPLETLLNRLESLQLLSRPTATHSGDQQILALPMKIGGEWTEVNVKFVKKRNRDKNGSKNQQYAVSLNVSPSKLGGIDVRMEYEVKKSLRLSMTFENELTADWFSDHETAFRMAIAGLGVPLTRFELHKRTLPKAATPVSQNKKDGFDITV